MKKAIGNPHPKINLVHTICDTAMQILYNSELENTTLWPKIGFAAGYGIGCEKKDRIHYFCFVWDLFATPPTGHLQFNILNTADIRKLKQEYAIRVIYDQAYYNNIYFKNIFPRLPGYLRFKFIIDAHKGQYND